MKVNLWTEKQLQALANELAKKLSQFDRLLTKLSVAATLNAEMAHYLGYENNHSKPGTNSRNGYSTKTAITGDSPLELLTPRDSDGTFEPQLIKKNQLRITVMDNQLLSHENTYFFISFRVNEYSEMFFR